jgi:mono/diheme cytochrome c family protein
MKLKPFIIVGAIIAVVLMVFIIWQVKTISGSGSSVEKSAKFKEVTGIYKKNCARCHGDEGQGYADKPAIESTKHSVAEIKQIISGGLSKMPAFPNIKEPVLTELSEFVYNL